MKILTIFFKVAIKYAKNCKLPVEMNTLNTHFKSSFQDKSFTPFSIYQIIDFDDVIEELNFTQHEKSSELNG